MLDTVLALTLVTGRGEVVRCGRDSVEQSERDLFGAVLGGLGQFGYFDCLFAFYAACVRVNVSARPCVRVRVFVLKWCICVSVFVPCVFV